MEKPREPPSDLAVVGVYFFRALKPSWRGEYEVTDLIQWFIDNGYRVGYDVVNGWWKDVGTPEGLLETIYLLLDESKPRIDGEVTGEVVGRVIVEEGAVVEGRVYGPAYVGRGTYIGRDAAVEHYVSIEGGSRVLSGSISRSLIMSDSVIDGRLRLVGSVVGRGCVVEASGELRLATSDY